MYFFHCRRHFLPLGTKTYVMGILNLTPDSFSGDGCFENPEQARDKVKKIFEDGADILDIGANSTRPGANILSYADEMERLKKYRSLFAEDSGLIVSIDTFYPECADFALQNGASIINDISGVYNPQMAKVVRKYDAGLIITHNPRGIYGASQNMEYPEGVVAHIRSFFESVSIQYRQAGILANQICLDPGIGFSKTYKQNLEVLRHLSDTRPWEDCCILCAASRKRVIAAACDEKDPQKRDAGTVAAHTIAILNGANVIRVHDTHSGVHGARFTDAVLHSEC